MHCTRAKSQIETPETNANEYADEAGSEGQREIGDEQDIIQKMSSPPLSGPVPLPPRKKAPRVAPPKPATQSSSAPPRRSFPDDGYIQASFGA